MSSTATCFPAELLPWLLEATGLEPGEEALPEVLEPLYGFQRAWVTDGAPAAAELYDAATVRAYSLFYMPINMPKLWFMLDRAWPAIAALFAEGRRVVVTDAGCGPGTLTWALLFYLRVNRPAWLKQVVIRGLDRNGGFLETARRLAAGLARWPELQAADVAFVEADWTQALPAETDLLLLGNTVVELGANQMACLATPPARVVCMLEPGTQAVFGRVLALRDQWLAAGWQVHFPCPAAAACPMAGAANWCHFHVNRLTLPHVQRMAAKASRLNPRHHFTGFVLSAPGVADVAAGAGDWRALSTVRRVHRSAVRWLCDGSHLAEVVLNRRAKQPHNTMFQEAAPGDLLRVTPPGQLAKQARLNANQQVTVVDRSPAAEL